MVWLLRNAQKRQFFGTIKSYFDTKNQKKLWSRSSGIYPDRRTEVRTYECKSIVPSKFLGRSNNNMELKRM